LKLTQAQEFRAALASECRFSGNTFLLRAIGNELSGARLGLITSRKAARRAVDRNRAKRLARVAFRQARVGLPAVDVVLQLKNDMRESGNAEIRRELDRLLRTVARRFGDSPPAGPMKLIT
jgi:ribonuclease P protein component